MKRCKRQKTSKIFSIADVASGELFVHDLDRNSWWRIPTENTPIDTEKLIEDCQSIYRGQDSTAYLEYIGIHDSTDALITDSRYERFIGVRPFGKFHGRTSELVIEPWYAGPNNLRLFGMEDQISELPENVRDFHSECYRICRKLILTANECKRNGDDSSWLFRISIANNLQCLRFRGLMSGIGNMIITSGEKVWDTLVELCRSLDPSKPEDAMWICIAALEFDGVYLPIRNDIIKGIKDSPKLLNVCFQHAARM